MVAFDELSPEQQLVVEANDKRLMVFGGAGTGKTTTALWAARYVIEATEQPTRVLFLTFSRTATSRLIQRSGGLIPAPLLRYLEIHTFHGFAYRLLCDFGRYAGFGTALPILHQEAEKKLLGRGRGRIGYEDLVPNALAMLNHPIVGELFDRRWDLVICDEFQDTSTDQWLLLQRLSRHARLLLLADPNQMIYAGFVPGVSAARIDEARRLPDMRPVTLPRASWRDPSQVLPAAADAILRRDFMSEAVQQAVGLGRLRVVQPVGADELPKIVAEETRSLRAEGAESVGVFVHTNQAVEELCSALSALGIPCTPMGLSEAYSLALAAQFEVVLAALGQSDWERVRTGLALYLTALTRGKYAPEAARRLHDGHSLPSRRQQAILDDLRRAISDADELSAALRIASLAWPALGFDRGDRTWRNASAALRATLAGRTTSQGSFDDVAAEVMRRQMNTLVHHDPDNPGTVQVMNLHQTKGREVDATILCCKSDDYLGNEREPYARNSPLLYVVLTRARQSVTIFLPQNPHGLVAPLARYAGASAGAGASDRLCK